MSNIIRSFDGKYRFLSNFYKCTVRFDGLVYKNSEAAFQSAKILGRTQDETLALREPFTFLNPSEAKRAGRRCILRSDWEAVKVDIMRDIIKSKFIDNKDLAKKLLETGDSVLVEGNTWHDNYWGCCKCDKCASIKKHNMLGMLLMELRELIRINGIG